MLDDDFYIGVNTAINRFKVNTGYSFSEWNSETISKRQSILLELALDSWKINN